jgi:hypothetical protein
MPCSSKQADYDMFLFIEKGLRGGVSMVSQRYAKANNPRIEGYIPEKPTMHLMYYNANNLYGWGMSQLLATGGFECANIVTEEEIVRHPDDAEKGYILEVDLEYPRAARFPQCVPTGARANESEGRVNVRVPAKPPERDWGVSRDCEAGT